ncbi:hypothetical protein EBR96_01230, partial [bacterium]|nr:hypothetical protein [bacterium]
MSGSLFFFFASTITAFIVVLALGIFILIRNRGNNTNLKFGFFLLTVATGIFGDFFYITPLVRLFSPLTWAKISQITILIIPPLLLDFSFDFFGIRVRQKIRWLFYIVPSLFVLPALTTPWFVQSAYIPTNGIIQINGGWIYVLFSAAIGFSLLNLFGLCLYTLIKTKDRARRTQISYLLLGFIFISMASLLYFLPILGIKTPRLDNLFVAIFWLIIAYAVTKHDLIDIKVIITRSVSNLAAIIVGILPFVAIYLSRSTLPGGPAPYYALWCALVAFGLQPFRKWLQTTAEKKFLNDLHDVPSMIQEISAYLIRINSKDEMVQLIAGTISRHMEIDKGYFWFFDDGLYKCVLLKDGQQFPMSFFLSSTSATVTELRSQTEVLFKGNLSSEAISEIAELNLSDNSLILPVQSVGVLQAIVMIGTRLSEAQYTNRDRGLFNAVLNQITVVFDRINYQNELESTNAELKSLNRHLEDRVAEEVHIKNRALMLAQELSSRASLSTLASGIAHEIRNPMTAIKGAVEILEMKFSQGAADPRPWLGKVTVHGMSRRLGNESLGMETVALLEAAGLINADGIPQAGAAPFARPVQLVLPAHLEPFRNAILEELSDAFKQRHLFDKMRMVVRESERVVGIASNMMTYGANSGVTTAAFSAMGLS